MSLPLVITDLKKSFGDIVAIDGVTFSVAPGECIALVGHNGAGKTTLFKLILGLQKADAGSIAILGREPGAARVEIGFLPESVVFQKSLTGREHLKFFARLKKRSDEDIGALLDKVGLSEAGDRQSGTYSKGMRQRLGLAQALIGSPRLLILDEPTTGLDPSSRRAFYRLLETLREEGTTILLSSHALSELEANTSGVAIMKHGRLLAHGPLWTLAREAGLTVRVDVLAAPGRAADLRGALNGLHPEPGDGEDWLTLHSAAEDKLTVLRQVTALKTLVRDVQIQPTTLADLYEHFQNGGDATVVRKEAAA